MRTGVSWPVIIGSAFIVLGFLFIGIAALLNIGRDDRGPFFAMGFFASLIFGLGCFLWALDRKIAEAFKR